MPEVHPPKIGSSEETFQHALSRLEQAEKLLEKTQKETDEALQEVQNLTANHIKVHDTLPVKVGLLNMNKHIS